MSWKLDIGVSNEILRKERMFATMPGARIAVFGGVLVQSEWRLVLSRLLDVSDAETDLQRLRDALDARIGHRFAMPACIEESFSGMTSNTVSADLCRHIGVDPLRLAVIGGLFSRGTVKDGERSVTIECQRGMKGAPPRASIKVRLDDRAMWSAGRFTIRRTALPLTALQGLRGMDVDAIVDHAWEGWKSLKVTSAGLNGDATIVGTNATDAKRTAPLAA